MSDATESDVCAVTPELLQTMTNFIQLQKVPYFLPMAAVSLRIKGQPFSLQDHFFFEPMFRADLPRRAVWKTARQTGKTLNLLGSRACKSALMPFYNILIVCPRFEQVKRLSNLYMRPLLKDSPLKTEFFIDPEGEQTVLQRSFPNGSTQFYSFCFLDADRIRSLTASEICIDESVRAGTLIDGICIEKIKSGNAVDTFTPEGYIVPSVTTKDASYHGKRHCFRITTASGKSIEGTADHPLATSKGWLRIGEIIEYVGSIAAKSPATATRFRHFIGGRLSTKDIENIRRLSIGTRTRATRIQPGEVPDIVRVQQQKTRSEVEERLRKIQLGLANTLVTDLCLLVRSDISGRRTTRKTGFTQRQSGLSRWQKNHLSRMAATTHSGRSCLVVSGRRHTCQRQTGHHSNLLLHTARALLNRAIPQPNMESARLHLPESKKILGAVFYGGGDQTTTGHNPSPCSFFNDVQTGLESAVLRNLWKRGITPKPKNRLQSRLSSTALSTISTKLQTQSRQSPTRATTGAATISRKHKQLSGAGAYGTTALYRDTSRNHQTAPVAKISSIEKRPDASGQGFQMETRSILAPNKFTRRPSATCRQSSTISRKTETLPRSLAEVPAVSTRVSRQEKSLVADPIIRIEYTGEHDVWDIEIVGTNTYFANGIASHNCQDVDWSFIPVIEEVLSGSPRFRNRLYTGTPKTLDGPLEKLWQDSSQAEWAIPCSACNHENIPSLDQDLWRMIGQTTVVCAKCGKPVDPTIGGWLHGIPERRPEFVGYHIPQIIHPYHYRNPDNWRDLLVKQRRYPKVQFINECLGESFESSTRLITVSALRAACDEKHPNTIRGASARLRDYWMLAMGIDWGGGGNQSASYTTVCFAALKQAQLTAHVIYMERLKQSLTPNEELDKLLYLYKLFRPKFVAHDYGGAGAKAEMLLVNHGFDINTMFPFTYVWAPRQKIITMYDPPGCARKSYNIDKARSIMVLCEMTKGGNVSFPEWESSQDCLGDFMNLVEDRQERPRGSDILLVRRLQNMPDDNVHSINFAVAALWYSQHRYPALDDVLSTDLTDEELENIAPGASKGIAVR